MAHPKLRLEVYIMYDEGDARPARDRFLGSGFETLEDAIDCANQKADQLPQIDDQAEYGERYIRITGPTTVEDDWGNKKEFIKSWDFPCGTDKEFRGAIEQWNALGGEFRNKEGSLAKIAKALNRGKPSRGKESKRETAKA